MIYDFLYLIVSIIVLIVSKIINAGILIMGTGKKIVRFDFENCRNFAAYNRACKYAKQNVKVKGVPEINKKLSDLSNNYDGNIVAKTTAVQNTENKMYQAWMKCHFIKNIGKWICAILVLVIIYSIFTNQDNLYGGFSFLLFEILFVITIIFIVAEIVLRSKYNKFVRKIETVIYQITDEFSAKCNMYYEEIDNCYMNSLDATQRQLVLMQRQNESLQREMCKQNAAHHREMMDMQRTLQKGQEQMLASQEETKQFQKELLDIERKRESRRGY